MERNPPRRAIEANRSGSHTILTPREAGAKRKDPVIGQGDNLPSGQAFPKTYGAGTAGFKRLTFETFVEMKGGEYFFAPSIGFLTGL